MIKKLRILLPLWPSLSCGESFQLTSVMSASSWERLPLSFSHLLLALILHPPLLLSSDPFISSTTPSSAFSLYSVQCTLCYRKNSEFLQRSPSCFFRKIWTAVAWLRMVEEGEQGFKVWPVLRKRDAPSLFILVRPNLLSSVGQTKAPTHPDIIATCRAMC